MGKFRDVFAESTASLRPLVCSLIIPIFGLIPMRTMHSEDEPPRWLGGWWSFWQCQSIPTVDEARSPCGESLLFGHVDGVPFVRSRKNGHLLKVTIFVLRDFVGLREQLHEARC